MSGGKNLIWEIYTVKSRGGGGGIPWKRKEDTGILWCRRTTLVGGRVLTVLSVTGHRGYRCERHWVVSKSIMLTSESTFSVVLETRSGHR